MGGRSSNRHTAAGAHFLPTVGTGEREESIVGTPYLQILAGNELGRKHSITADRMVLGRHPDCDIVLDSAAVSRQHATLHRSGGEYYIEDLGSRNGSSFKVASCSNMATGCASAT